MSKVLLTGANGFVAVHILDGLLPKGYTVVGTVRSQSKIPYLQNKFAKYADKLQFVVVEDIAAPGAWDAVLEDKGIEFVLHTSSPFHVTA
jgi:nucleoside-diphosphate-sugar epimerase